MGYKLFHDEFLYQQLLIVGLHGAAEVLHPPIDKEFLVCFCLCPKGQNDFLVTSNLPKGKPFL